MVRSFVVSVILFLFLDILIAVGINKVFHTREPYTQLNCRTLQQCKTPSKSTLLFTTWIPATFCVYVYTYV